MITQTIFQPGNVVGADGWTELGGGTQPPNRALPAPIFDTGTNYQPSNGNTGSWIIQKTITSDVAGPGFLTIPGPSVFPNTGLFADDQITEIAVNGVAVPFTGLPSGNVPAQSVPVTWLFGANTVRITVLNTVAGGTSIAGRMTASGNGVPCDCCPTGPPQCALVNTIFSGAAETAAQAGWGQVNLALTADSITNTAALSGYNTAVGNTPSTTLRITYTTPDQRNRVRGLRLWNQAGGDLNDADGIRNFTAEFYAGAALLATQSWQAVNGGGAQTFTLPLGIELNGVTSVVLRNLDKQTGGSVAPLWRELQLLEFQTVFPCRRRSGALEWYNADGVLVPTADVTACEQPTLFTMPDLQMNGAAFGDDPSGTAENMCNVVPVPATATGWTLTSGCYDPVTGNPFMTWNSVSSIEMSYGDNGNGQPSGGVLLGFLSSISGNITWPANGASMVVGEQRLSNPFAGGRRARLTYVSGPPGTNPAGTIRMEGGTVVGLHRLVVSAELPIRFRVDFINP